MQAYKVQVGSSAPFIMLAEDHAALFDRLSGWADIAEAAGAEENNKLFYMTKYNSAITIQPMGRAE